MESEYLLCFSNARMNKKEGRRGPTKKKKKKQIDNIVLISSIW
jgi:hypothetical protein